MDQNVGTCLEGAARLPTSLGMHTNGQPTLVCGTDNGAQRCVIQQWSTAVQHEFDQVVPVCSGLIDCPYAVRRSRQFPYRPWRCPGPIGRISGYSGEELSSDLDRPTRRRIDLPVARDARQPTEIVYLHHRGIGQRGRIDQTKVNMPVDQTRHYRTRKLHDAGLLDRRTPERHRMELTRNLLKHSWSESMADPKILNGKPHGYLPISVRTA
jgi:hypothetical protein